MSAIYEYSEPFSCECRAFGRLQEDGYEELAVRCYGYVLLDEEHERVVMDQFSHLEINFNGNIQYSGYEDLRSRFVGKGVDRAPPIRGIVKEFGPTEEDLQTRGARRILKDIIRLQQLGIIHIDVGHRQLVGGKLCDFSTAITVPHFITTPELNPCLEPEWIPALEFETFQFSINDYWEFDEMVREWNYEQEERKTKKKKISVYAFPGGRGCRIKYDLRSTPLRERVYSFVDPRLYDWRTSSASPRKVATGARGRRKSGRGTTGGRHGKLRRLAPRPPRWYLDCDKDVATRLKNSTSFSTSLDWEFRDGLIFPRKRGWFHARAT